ncbi:MAG: polysaccharide biosynthesis C-terminal domain-containing protein [Myxococcaceae bacterium]|nr:polysaccharide biosynthesis C-terminal domain-containing protein [Myxococcaceae bacterium]
MTAPPPKESTQGVEAYSAVANAMKLASSLVVSFGITIAVRQFFIPRTLGTERFGELNFADGFAGLFLVAAWLGIDTWMRKELGVTLKSADGIWGGVAVVRTVMGIVLTGAMVVTLKLLGRSDEIIIMAVVFAIAQLMIMTQNTASALLHAAGKVGGLSVVNIVGKLMWAAIVIPALFLNLPLMWLAVAFLVSETFKALTSAWLAKVHTDVTLRVDVKAAWRAIKDSTPFWVNNIALVGTGRADVALVGSLAVGILGSTTAADREIGWYTLVLGIAGMLMVVIPVIGWVLLPLLSRAIVRGEEEAAVIIRRAVEVCVVLGAPLSIGGFVAADELIALYKPEYAPSALVLKIMSFTFALTYLNVVAANCLAALGRGWTVTLTSISTLLITPLLDLIFVPPALRTWGPGYGAAACALAIVIAEIFTTSVMLRSMGRLAVDRRLLSVTGRTLVTCLAVIGVDFALKRFVPGLNGWLRVALDAVTYVTLALVTKSVRIAEARAFVQLAKAQRSARGAEAPA